MTLEDRLKADAERLYSSLSHTWSYSYKASEGDILRDLILAQLRETLARERRMAWQPIATAPKDGTLFFCCASSTRGIWLYDMCWWDADDGEWASWRWHSGNGVDTPTHWMPMPDPPSDLIAPSTAQEPPQ